MRNRDDPQRLRAARARDLHGVDLVAVQGVARDRDPARVGQPFEDHVRQVDRGLVVEHVSQSGRGQLELA